MTCNTLQIKSNVLFQKTETTNYISLRMAEGNMHETFWQLLQVPETNIIMGFNLKNQHRNIKLQFLFSKKDYIFLSYIITVYTHSLMLHLFLQIFVLFWNKVLKVLCIKQYISRQIFTPKNDLHMTYQRQLWSPHIMCRPLWKW